VTVQVFNCEQGSPEWHEARRGIPTASEFAAIIAKGRGGDESKTRRTYLLKLAGEVLTGDLMENYTNAQFDRGKVMEPEARELYEFLTDDPVSTVGFIRNGDAGCSPDALVGDRGLLEIKTALPHLLIDRLLRGDFPPEHKAQCQGALWVSEREWIDIAVYWPKLPLFTKRAHRDEAYIADLAKAVEAFNAELADTVEAVRNYESRASLKAALTASVEAAA
jgi:hypothetical protein